MVKAEKEDVTILILIDGFLQLKMSNKLGHRWLRHNPYFNRWFSAIRFGVVFILCLNCHNPYFNRWFSAIKGNVVYDRKIKVTILILIDGFLQCLEIIWLMMSR